VCNAAESLLVHESVAATFLPRAAAALAGVELVGDDGSVTVLKESIPVLAGEVVDATVMRARALDAFLTEQIAAVHPERLFVVGRGARLDGATRKPLELLHVDPQVARRAKLHLLPGRDDELGIRAGGQFRLEGTARKMNDLVQIRRTRFRIEVGPDGVDELLAMQLVSGIQRQELHEQLGLRSRPSRVLDRVTADEDAEVSKELNRQPRCVALAHCRRATF